MSGTVHMMEQRSPEWHAHRVGRVTASRIADLMAKTRTGWGASRANYMADLIAERLTGEAREGFTNAAMQWGTETEPQARATYEFVTDLTVTEVGFIDHPNIPMAGCSPDGLVGEDGMIEVKCPNTATHLDTLLNGTIPDKYLKQMMFQMACADREWCDFVSFDPRLPAEMQLWVQRIPRERETVAEIEEAVASFIAELDGKVADLRSRYMGEAA
jgi:putative phage-type endonuclease